MMTSIPTFNLEDVCAAAIKLLENPNINIDELYCPIDFPTGGIIINESEVKESLKRGTGKAAMLRAKIEYDSTNREIIVTELPYQVMSSTIVAQIQQCVEDGKLPGVESVFDGSDINGVRICVKLARAVNVENIIKLLYKETSLQSHFTINMILLENGTYPRVYSFVEILKTYLSHAEDVLRKSFEFDLKEIQDRLEILEGYLGAIAHIDEVLSIVKTSESKSVAAKKLTENLGFSARQSEAILELKLQRLVNLEHIKIQKERDQILEQIKHLEFILSEEKELQNQLKKEILRISKEYGDDRRTQNLDLKQNNETEEIIEERNLIVHLTNYGNVHIDETSTLMAQKRGGKGSKIKLQKGELVVKSISGKNTSSLLAFSNQGRAFTVDFDDLITTNNINNLLDLTANEQIFEMTLPNAAKHILFITQQGMIKKSELNTYHIKRNKGVIALKLNEGDKLIKVLLINDENLALLTRNGLFKIIDTSDIAPIGRVAMGVIGIKLNPNDIVAGAQIVEKESAEIISITDNGLAARCSLKEFESTGRAAKGKTLQKGQLIDFVLVTSKDKHIIVVSSKNTIKIPVVSIPLTNRNAAGIRAINQEDIIIGVLRDDI